MERESIEVDVIIVGGGPAGLSAAIRLGQLANQQQKKIKICVLEKGAQIGAHILSGAVFEPRALNELIPNWPEKKAPLNTLATMDEFLFLTAQKSFTLPTPPQMKNQGNYIISLGLLTRWLSLEAESLGVEIFSGFAATELLFDNNQVIGVATNPVGLDKMGKPKSSFQPGMELHAPYTLLAEGARGSLTKIVSEKFKLHDHCDPQTYAIGIKEIWEISNKNHQPGKITHTVGWPLDPKTYGGSFLYHLEKNQLAIGLVIGLDYTNPYLDPHQEFQRFKHHPHIQPLLDNGRRLAYGARALNEGGLQSIPKLSFPGGLILGCSAGFLNVPKLKGNHTAMKSGMLAAEQIFEEINGQSTQSYQQRIEHSWIWKELTQAKNIRPAFQKGLWPGLVYSALDTYLLRNRAPWTFHHKADHLSLKKASDCKPIDYPKPDGKITFDKLSSIRLSNTNHEDNQPVHLRLQDQTIPININLALYDAPEQRYCPAEVYEILYDQNGKNPYLQINAQNCIHCKTCDIKDPKQNIRWVPPEGGGGPNYSEM